MSDFQYRSGRLIKKRSRKKNKVVSVYRGVYPFMRVISIKALAIYSISRTCLRLPAKFKLILNWPLD